MSTSVRDELLWRFGKSEDPEVEARRQHILKVLLETSPKTRQELTEEASLSSMRTALREVLASRQFVVSKDDEARLEACTDLVTLKRWLRQAVTAPTVADALR